MKNKYSSIFSRIFLLIISIVAIIIGWIIANESYWIILNYPLELLPTCCLDGSCYCLVDDFRSSVAFTVWIMYGLFVGFICLSCFMIYIHNKEKMKPNRYIASLNDPKCFEAKDLGIIERTRIGKNNLAIFYQDALNQRDKKGDEM